MFTQLGKLALVAALAVTPTLVTTPAYAADAGAKAFCAKASPILGCSVGYSFGTSTGVDEGAQGTALLQGSPNYTGNFKVFSVGDKGVLTAVSGDIAVTTDGRGGANVKFTAPTLKAPQVGGEHFVLQPSDATDAGKDTIANSAGKLEAFAINSHRAQVVGIQNPTAANQLGAIKLDGGISGDGYVAEVLVNGKWVNINYEGKPAVISSNNVTALSWRANVDVPRGEYPLRVRNVGNNEVIHTNTLLVGVSAPSTPGAPAPTTKVPSPTKKPASAPKQDPGSSKGLAKTGA